MRCPALSSARVCLEQDTLLNKAIFTEDSDEMVMLRNIEIFSMCAPPALSVDRDEARERGEREFPA
eukprot:3799817-Rhodomonas_salina.1